MSSLEEEDLRLFIMDFNPPSRIRFLPAAFSSANRFLFSFAAERDMVIQLQFFENQVTSYHLIFLVPGSQPSPWRSPQAYETMPIQSIYTPMITSNLFYHSVGRDAVQCRAFNVCYEYTMQSQVVADRHGDWLWLLF